MFRSAQQILTYKAVQTRLYISLNSAPDGGEWPVIWVALITLKRKICRCSAGGWAGRRTGVNAVGKRKFSVLLRI